MRSSVKKSKAGSQNAHQKASKPKRPFFDQSHTPEPFFQKASKTGDNVSLKSATDSYSLLDAEVLQPEVTSVNGTIIATVYFAQNSSLLFSDNYKVVEQLAEQLKSMSKPTIVVDGYASAEGTDEYNLELSEKRRFAVNAILSSKAGSLNIQGKAYGESKAAEAGQQHSFHRRVTIFIAPVQESKQAGLSFDPMFRLPEFRFPTETERLEWSLQEKTPNFFKTQSLSVQFDGVVDKLLKKMNVPTNLRPLVKKGVRALVEKGTEAALDNALDQTGMSDKEKKAFKTSIQGIVKVEF